MARVLIIDDNAERMRQLADAARDERYDCRTTRSTARPVELSQKLRPDLIVVGLGAQAEDTRALCEQLRTVAPFADAPILVTGNADRQHDALGCMDCGASDWLPLPLADALIRTRIRSMVTAKRDRQIIREQERILDQRRQDLDSTLSWLKESKQLLEDSQRSEEFLATHDRVTDLPNRQLFDEFGSRAVDFAKRNSQTAAVLSLDLDRFARVNDTLGRSAGDQLLKSVAERFKGCIRDSDMVARLGGDELTALLQNLRVGSDAVVVAEKLLVSISRPHQIAGQEVRITPSIGIAVFPDHGQNHEHLIRHAETAVKTVKEQGGNGHCFYSPSMRQEASRRERLEQDLYGAADGDQFIVYYQPQIDVRKGTLIGAEAFVRWNHPELGFLSPGEFIPLAEESGLIVKIGDWVLRQACAQKRRWEAIGMGSFPVSVNVSLRQLKVQSFPGVVLQILKESGLEPSHLNLEITENMMIDDVEGLRERLTILAETGVRVSIDDFGTGYSSLSILGKFPAHTLKIDQAFVREIATNSVQAAITRTVMAVAKELGMNTVAEGVETEDQMRRLAELGCAHMQGYLFGRPADGEEFEREWGDSAQCEIKLPER